jgi:AraC-like DNA-binding protein
MVTCREDAPIFVRLRPRAELAPYVACVWYSDERARREPRPARERVLPTGRADLVVRLEGEPIRALASAQDPGGTSVGHAAISGMRARHHVRDVARPSCTLGVHFRAGGLSALLGLPSDELAGRHTALAELWGDAAHDMRERLRAQRGVRARLALLEDELLARRQCRPGLPPQVARYLASFAAGEPLSVGAWTRAEGQSRRHLSELFRRWVGLTPKLFARVQRFQAVVRRAAAAPGERWTDLALACGYFDQSHLVRDFRELAGIAPGAYAPHSAARPNHLPLVQVGHR